MITRIGGLGDETPEDNLKDELDKKAQADAENRDVEPNHAARVILEILAPNDKQLHFWTLECEELVTNLQIVCVPAWKRFNLVIEHRRGNSPESNGAVASFDTNGGILTYTLTRKVETKDGYREQLQHGSPIPSGSPDEQISALESAMKLLHEIRTRGTHNVSGADHLGGNSKLNFPGSR